MHGMPTHDQSFSAASVLITGLMLLVATGCGGTTDDTANKPESNATASSTAPTQSTTPGATPAGGGTDRETAAPPHSGSAAREQTDTEPKADTHTGDDRSQTPQRNPAELPVLTAPGTEPADTAEQKVSLVIKSWEDTQQFIAAQDADLVVVDFWSTSCVPCIREFPHLVELYRKFRDRGVQCVSVCCDYEGIADTPPEKLVGPALAFLRKHNATFPNILLSTPSDEFYDAFDLGSIPAVAVYARGGKLLKRFDNDQATSEEDSFTYEKDVFPFVEQQLAKLRAKTP